VKLASTASKRDDQRPSRLPARKAHATCAARQSRVCGQESLVLEIDRRLPFMWRAGLLEEISLFMSRT
jgi:hypothetical protein